MKTHVSNLPELVAEVVMGWKLGILNDDPERPAWFTQKGRNRNYAWNPVTRAENQEEMVDTLGTYAVSKEEEGYYFTVYRGGEAYEGFNENKRVAACIAALKANGMEVEI